MSHHLKSSARSDKLRREFREWESKQREIAKLAALVRDQADLDRLLEGADGELRRQLLEMVTPHLSFKPEAPIADCPRCGFRRGTVLEHDCPCVPA